MVFWKKEKEEKIVFSISGSQALRIALEDSETSYFIKTNFSCPEQKPEIISQKWISRCDFVYKWNVEIIEKIRFPFTGESEMTNIALIEIDSFSGKIIKRQYFKNVFLCEYKKKVTRDDVGLLEEGGS